MPTFTLEQGDTRERLREMPTASVQCVVTSPPYWGLRDYGMVEQIGLEPTPDLYVQRLVEVFRHVWRVLTDDGTVWLNLGDSYANGGRKTRDPGQSKLHPAFVGGAYEDGLRPDDPPGIKPKDLLGIPWRVAFALQADGWYLRSDIIWHKPNPMPESVTDRPTKAHEYLFLLTKQERYYYDADAIREPLSEYYTSGLADNGGVKAERPAGMDNFSKERRYTEGMGNASTRVARTAFINPDGRNKRSVWSISPASYAEAHFATMPEALAEPCVLAGSKAGDLVLDPFAGAGTTGVVALRLERSFIGVELNPEYVALARARLHDVAPMFVSEVLQPSDAAPQVEPLVEQVVHDVAAYPTITGGVVSTVDALAGSGDLRVEAVQLSIEFP